MKISLVRSLLVQLNPELSIGNAKSEANSTTACPFLFVNTTPEHPLPRFKQSQIHTSQQNQIGRSGGHTDVKAIEVVCFDSVWGIFDMEPHQLSLEESCTTTGDDLTLLVTTHRC